MATDERFHQTGSPTTPRFADVATFMRTRRHDIMDDIDIGLVGVPFDLGVNFRTGARQGPSGVREASRLIRRVHPTSGVKPFDVCNVADLGDSPINPLSLENSIGLIQGFFDDIHGAGIRPIAIGGDHTIPLPILRAIARDKPVGMLHFDAHPDTLDELCGTKINHATFLRRAHEEGLVRPENVVQVGLRGSRFSDHDVQYGIDVGFTLITMDEYEEMGRAAAIDSILETLDAAPVYISLDIDGIDPAYAPGTGVPEIGGLMPRDVQVIIRSLRGRNIVGADISEVAPCFDPTGITCVTAANLMFEILCVMADPAAATE